MHDWELAIESCIMVTYRYCVRLWRYVLWSDRPIYAAMSQVGFNDINACVRLS